MTSPAERLLDEGGARARSLPLKLSTRDLREHLLSRIARLAREDAEHRALAAAASDEGDDDRAAEEEAEAAHCTTAILCFREVLDLLP